MKLNPCDILDFCTTEFAREYINDNPSQSSAIAGLGTSLIYTGSLAFVSNTLPHPLFEWPEMPLLSWNDPARIPYPRWAGFGIIYKFGKWSREMMSLFDDGMAHANVLMALLERFRPAFLRVDSASYEIGGILNKALDPSLLATRNLHLATTFLCKQSMGWHLQGFTYYCPPLWIQWKDISVFRFIMTTGMGVPDILKIKTIMAMHGIITIVKCDICIAKQDMDVNKNGIDLVMT
ncbi:hypothetical protein CEXT_292671 [Caerostris extrusa]|uniref:Uncharacterized protein n=1 Tax=Caerostris extrusa TaxID=172846 RepID=A0AAV4W8X2_CAEEX|nr:hypothetical protein CEXT_292671 [Caerostris extrusa]